MGVKTAIMHTKKPGVLSLKQGYHGLDLGAMALTGMGKFRTPFTGFDTHPSVKYIDSGTDISGIKKIIYESRNSGVEIGQILVEPILGRFGSKKHKDGWLKELYSFTKENDLLLIFDEVFTGLGRTGKTFRAFEDSCDILCMGKAIGGGMPVSAVACSAEIMNSWPESNGEAIHTGTFFGHPLSCLVGQKTLEIFREESLVNRSKELGEFALEKLKKELESLSHLKEVRGEGLMIAIEFTEPLMGVHDGISKGERRHFNSKW